MNISCLFVLTHLYSVLPSTHWNPSIHLHVEYPPKWSVRRRPNQTGLHTIKSVPLQRTSTGSCPDLERTRVGFASIRLAVFNVHHCSWGLSSLSKFVVILGVCCTCNSRSPSSLSKSLVVLHVTRCYRSSSSRLLLLKPIISRAARASLVHYCLQTLPGSTERW